MLIMVIIIAKRQWSFIKYKKKDQCSIPLIHVADSVLTDSQEKYNAFNDYFTSIFTQEDLSTVPTIIDIPFPDIPPFQFLWRESPVY